MSFLKKLFGRPTEARPEPETATQFGASDTSEPGFIGVRDTDGGEINVARTEWYDKILVGRFKSGWNDPDQLAETIALAIRDDFFNESIEPAKRMLALEDSARSRNLLADAYLGACRTDEAERVVRDCISKHGKSGANLTNLAHVETLRGDYRSAEKTLVRALQIDPNYERALCWYESGVREKYGEEAGIAAIGHIASLSGAWRPQLWLGRHAMSSDQPQRGVALFRECLANAGRPIQIEVLADISAALGSSGYFKEIEEIVEPAFEPGVHGIHVGSNLMRAHTEMGQFDKARRILDQLRIAPHPALDEQLQYWTKVLTTAEAP